MPSHPIDQAIDALTAWTVRVVQYNESVARKMGVTPSELQCLYLLGRRGPMSPGDIGREVGLTTGAASRLVERLVVARLATRNAAPHDRRRVIVTAAPDALDRVQEMYLPLTESLREHLARMSPEAVNEIAALARNAEVSTESAGRRA